jgi:hypothetical protein
VRSNKKHCDTENEEIMISRGGMETRFRILRETEEERKEKTERKTEDSLEDEI